MSDQSDKLSYITPSSDNRYLSTYLVFISIRVSNRVVWAKWEAADADADATAAAASVGDLL